VIQDLATLRALRVLVTRDKERVLLLHKLDLLGREARRPMVMR
jgi:hypothetical protein